MYVAFFSNVERVVRDGTWECIQLEWHRCAAFG